MHPCGTKQYHVSQNKDTASLSPESCIESECLRSQLQLRLKTAVQLHCCLHAGLQTVQLLSQGNLFFLGHLWHHGRRITSTVLPVMHKRTQLKYSWYSSGQTCSSFDNATQTCSTMLASQEQEEQ